MEVPLTPLDFLRRARKLHGAREAVVDGGERWSYEEFGTRCDRWSSALQRLGVTQGDRVAYIAPNTHRQLESFYAVPQIGAVLVPINFRLVPDDFRYMIQHSGAKIVCAGADHTAAVDSIRGDLKDVEHFVSLDGPRDGWLDYESLLKDASAAFDRPSIGERDLLTINYTSGTTSRPKGVMITHRNAWMNSVGMLMHWPMTPGDAYLWTLPMFHANGWTFTWSVTAAGAKHVCLPKFDAPTIFKIVAKEQVTRMCAAPTVLIMLANAPAEAKALAPKGVGVMTAGAPPAAVTIQRIEEELGWSIIQIYGLTETAPGISICEPLPEHRALSKDDRAKIKARQGVEFITSGELRVVDDQRRDVPRDGKTPGEIIARGNVVMAGYYNDPDATAKCMGDGWFKSGDAAVVHPDGYVQITDRLKDVIISGGENISSVEVEAMLLRHDAIQEVAVVGVPSEKWGESPHAFVVFKTGQSATPEALRQFCRDNMAHFKVPHGFTPIGELPKTATGKIQKFVLRKGRANITAQ
ncbi:MAG: long-chain-fatty-acid--CoA ligase [Cyanobacteria bacterium]|nr:long-chain-fatty-acid--CoA ligase [Cyanobacteriota bacterium]